VVSEPELEGAVVDSVVDPWVVELAVLSSSSPQAASRVAATRATAANVRRRGRSMGITPTRGSRKPTRGSVPAKAQSSNQDIVRLACSIPHEQLLRTYRGWRPDRGAQISFIPKEPNFVGSGLPHVGPWDYIQTVPMLWYGPGYIKPQGEVNRPVTSADVAPTSAELLKFDGFHAPDDAHERGAPAGRSA
jgi:hypothetical protein